MLTSYCQRDERWSNLLIPNSKVTIGRFGCTITSIADLSTYFGDNLTPDRVAGLCRFTSEGLILWQSCKFNKFEFVRREYVRNDANIKAALMDPNKAVILEVGNKSHWVCAISTFANDYRIADPWLGDKVLCLKRYPNITGAAYFKRK